MFRVFIFFVLLLSSSLSFSEIYDFTGPREKEAEVLSQDGVFIELRLKEVPQAPTPVFLYDIEKIKNPHKITDKVFNQSVFLLEKGNLYFSRKEYYRALDYYNQALSVNPSFAVGYHNIGIVHFILGNYTRSIKSFEKIIGSQYLNGHAYFYLGWIYKKLENISKSEYYLKIAKEIFESENDRVMLRETEEILDSLKILFEQSKN